MMPLTCGRSSASAEAMIRPGRAEVRVTFSAFIVTTVTAGGGASPPGAWADAELARVIAPRTDARKTACRNVIL